MITCPCQQCVIFFFVLNRWYDVCSSMAATMHLHWTTASIKPKTKILKNDAFDLETRWEILSFFDFQTRSYWSKENSGTFFQVLQKSQRAPTHWGIVFSLRSDVHFSMDLCYTYGRLPRKLNMHTPASLVRPGIISAPPRISPVM